MNKCKYNSIIDFDINQSNGVSVSLWMQGCEHHCEGCYNKETWDFNKGYDFTQDTINKIIHILTNDSKIHKNLSILGGETLSPNKIEMLTELVKKVKNVNKSIQIWIWTGYLYEDIYNLELLNYIDYVIDGKYIKELHEITRYKGSKNQRIIDVKKSLKEGEIILHCE